MSAVKASGRPGHWDRPGAVGAVVRDGQFLEAAEGLEVASAHLVEAESHVQPLEADERVEQGPRQLAHGRVVPQAQAAQVPEAGECAVGKRLDAGVVEGEVLEADQGERTPPPGARGRAGG